MPTEAAQAATAELEIKASAIEHPQAGFGLWVCQGSKYGLEEGDKLPVEMYIYTDVVKMVKQVRAAGGTGRFCTRDVMTVRAKPLAAWRKVAEQPWPENCSPPSLN